MLRFDLSEFAAFHAYKLLIGDNERPGSPARLADPVRQQPFQVVLFDELEKGHPNNGDLLLQILDKGRLGDALDVTIDFTNTFVIATTNVGSDAATRRPAGFGAGNGDHEDGAESDARLREGLEAFFRPEFLNRIPRVVPFHALRREDVERIVRKEVALMPGR